MVKIKRQINPDSACEELGDRLKIIRRNNQLSQEKLAGLLGIHLRTYSNYERGQKLHDVGFIQKISELFHVGPSWLLFGDKNFANDSSVELQGETVEPNLSNFETEPGELETELLEKIIDHTFNFFGEEILLVPKDKLAQVIAILYETAIQNKQWRKEAGLGKMDNKILSLLRRKPNDT